MFCHVKSTLSEMQSACFLVIVQRILPVLACHHGTGLGELQIKSFTELYG